MVGTGAKAEKLIEEISRELGHITERISNHPYLRDLEAGKIRKDMLSVFVQQQYHTVNLDLKSLALSVVKAKTREAREYMIGALNMEAEALRRLLTLGEALGLDEGALRRSEPIAAALSYANYITTLTLHGSEHKLVAAFVVDTPAWGGNCVRMKNALQQRYGIPNQALKFFEMFSTPADEAARRISLSIVEGGLWKEDDEGNVRTACRLVLEYELMFWDAIYRASL